jgi:TM2 domain-containing membrane protein YozV
MVVQCKGQQYWPTDAVQNATISCVHLGEDPKAFRTALALSVFGGVLGLDRFYLGYPALGLLKLSTGGCFLLWWLLDVVLIATQTLKPSDGTEYWTGYYDLRMRPILVNPADAVNSTAHLLTPADGDGESEGEGSSSFYQDYTCGLE